MKAIKFLALALVALIGMTACSDDKEYTQEWTYTGNNTVTVDKEYPPTSPARSPSERMAPSKWRCLSTNCSTPPSVTSPLALSPSRTSHTMPKRVHTIACLARTICRCTTSLKVVVLRWRAITLSTKTATST